jgi:hypothetical protein
MMARSFVRLPIAVFGVAFLVAAGLPASTATASVAASAKAPAVGDSCLVGTWHDNGGKTTTQWNGKTVKMRTGGGDVDHISASGIDHASWATSKVEVGKVRGHRLTERIRGHNKVRILANPHAHTVVYTELGWTPKSSNRYVYLGKHSKGYLNQTGKFTTHYHCSATKLIFRSKGKAVDTETRLSTKP